MKTSFAYSELPPIAATYVWINCPSRASGNFSATAFRIMRMTLKERPSNHKSHLIKPNDG